MTVSVVQIILIFIVSCLSGIGSVLDEFESHQPLITCTLMGIVLGDPVTGIIIGGTLQMMVLGWMNVGAAQSPDTALAGTISTILVIAGHQKIGAGIAVAMPVAVAGQVLTVFVRTLTTVFQHKADQYAEQGNFRGIDLCHIGSLAFQALRVAIPTVIAAAFVGSNVVQTMLNAIPKVITSGLTIGGGFIVAVGYAMVINSMGAKHLMPFFFLGFIIAGAVPGVTLLGLGVVGVCIAIVYLQLKPEYNMPTTVVTTASSSGSDDELD